MLQKISPTCDISDSLGAQPFKGESFQMELDRDAAIKRIVKQALSSTPGRVPPAQAQKIIEYHQFKGLLPRYFSVRIESFSRDHKGL